MSRQISHIQNLNADLQQERSQLAGDLAQAREEVRRVQDAMQIETQKSLNELRERMLLEQAEMQSKYESEIKNQRQKGDTVSTDLQ